MGPDRGKLKIIDADKNGYIYADLSVDEGPKKGETLKVILGVQKLSFPDGPKGPAHDLLIFCYSKHGWPTTLMETKDTAYFTLVRKIR